MNIHTVILFGSCSTGSSTDQSDVDIALISPDFQGLEFSKRFHLIGKHIIKTIQHHHIPMDVIPLTLDEYEKENSIRMTFIRSGVLFDSNETPPHLAEV